MQDQRKPTPEARTESVFARRLRALRDEREVSQVKLAEKLTGLGLRINDLAILRIEKNAEQPESGRRVRLGEAALIARALGVRLDEMLRETSTLEEQLAKAEADYQQARYHQVSAELSAKSAAAAAAAAADLKAELAERIEEERLLTEALESAPTSAASEGYLLQMRHVVEEYIDSARRVAAFFHEHDLTLPASLHSMNHPDMVAAVSQLGEAFERVVDVEEKLKHETTKED